MERRDYETIERRRRAANRPNRYRSNYGRPEYDRDRNYSGQRSGRNFGFGEDHDEDAMGMTYGQRYQADSAWNNDRDYNYEGSRYGRRYRDYDAYDNEFRAPRNYDYEDRYDRDDRDERGFFDRMGDRFDRWGDKIRDKWNEWTDDEDYDRERGYYSNHYHDDRYDLSDNYRQRGRNRDGFRNDRRNYGGRDYDRYNRYYGNTNNRRGYDW